MDEQIFIKTLVKNFPSNGKNVAIGIGDDAAVFQPSKEKQLLATCDVQVEDVHFKRDWITPQNLGKRAVAVALSDIAAMGGVPTFLLVSLGIDAKKERKFLGQLFFGIQKACQEYKVDLVGGNISKTKTLFIDCFVLGETTANGITRSTAQPGDKVLVTGVLGKAAVFLQQKMAAVPIARIREGNIIAEKATAMIDISDGLSTDLLHLCDASGVGVRIYADKLPISSVLREGWTLNRGLKTVQNKVRPYERVLHGGEDYELCFTISPKNVDDVIKKVKEKTGMDVTVIGEILEKNIGRWLIDGGGKKHKLEAKGWDHFGRPVIPTKSR